MTSKSSLAVLLILLAAAVAVAVPMSGTYYIKKTGAGQPRTYVSFKAAGEALEANGLGGDVQFFAYAGVYNEGTRLWNVAGSGTFVTTFDKVPGQGEVTVTGSSAFNIINTHNVKVRNLTLRGDANGVYSEYSNGVKVEACKILESSHGCRFFGGNGDSVVRCMIPVDSMAIDFVGASAGNRSGWNHASNNMIANRTIPYSGTTPAIRLLYTDWAEVYFNTVSMGNAFAALDVHSADNWRIVDNVFKLVVPTSVPGGPCVLYIRSDGSPGGSEYCDYNDLYNSVGYTAWYDGVRYQTLADWQLTGFDRYSIDEDPLFVGGGDLHLTPGSPCVDKGEEISAITTDIDGEPRWFNTPDIGADEWIGAPEPPVLVSPPYDAFGEPVSGTLTWNAPARATSYDVYLDDVSYPPTKLVSENQTGTSYAYSGLLNDQTYYWKVVAKNSGGQTSSEVWYFTTIRLPPEAPVLVSPPNNTFNELIDGTLTWNVAARANRYYVYLDVTDPPTAMVTPGGQTGTSYAYSGLLNDQTYYWKVVAENEAGQAESEVWSFTTGTLDAGMTEILEPSGLIDVLSVVPQVTVHNFGTLECSLTAWFEIRYGAADGPVQYLQSVTVTGLGETDQTVSFPTWDVPNDQEGVYYAKSWTVLDGDIDATNDTARCQFEVVKSNPDPWGGSMLTQGYWKNHPYYDPQHPDAPYIEKYLPVTVATEYVNTVPKALAIFTPPKPMTSWKMFLIQFLAAKLNAGWQTDPSLLAAWYNYPGGDYPFDNQRVSAIFLVADGYSLSTDRAILDVMVTVFDNMNNYRDKDNHCLWDAPFPSGPGPQGVEMTALTTELNLSVAPSLAKIGSARIAYSLPKAAPAQLTVLDITGRTVMTQGLPAVVGTGVVSLDTRSLGAGVYIIKLATCDNVLQRKLVVQR